MSNINNKDYNEVYNNTQIIIKKFNKYLDEYPLPIVLYIDASLDEIIDAVKYIIDTGWISSNLYVRKMKYNGKLNKEEIVLIFTNDEKEFDYVEFHNYYKRIEDYPEIIGIPNYNKNSNNYYDGDVFIKLDNGNKINKKEWDKLKSKQLLKTK